MDPIECPYCGIDLTEWPGHDLFHCKMTAEGRAEVQVEELKELWLLEKPLEEKE